MRHRSPFTDDIAQNLPELGEYKYRTQKDGSTCKVDCDGICHTHDCPCWFCEDVVVPRKPRKTP